MRNPSSFEYTGADAGIVLYTIYDVRSYKWRRAIKFTCHMGVTRSIFPLND